MPARRALAALALALLVAPAPAAAAELAPLSLADVARLRSVREVAIAPDGELVAFVLAVPRRPWEEDDGPAWAELRVVDRAGRERSFVTGEVNVRLVQAGDGRPIVQMRVDLGILQMELSGRPDGTRPEGHDSLLEAVGASLRQQVENQGDAESFVLSSDLCRRLREEAIQFYHRYVSLFALEEYEGVMRDTEHNLHIMELCREFGETEFDQTVMEQLRCNTLMMYARAEACKALADNDTRAALASIDRGLEAIRQAMENEEREEEDAFPMLRPAEMRQHDRNNAMRMQRFEQREGSGDLQ